MSDRERKLTTIVAIDVAAYSRLMHADETGTLDRLRAARAITDPIADAHGARLVGTWGDGLLVEFPSVVEAVEFARKAQAAMAEFNEGTPEDQQLLYRIGINLGDVIIEDGDLFGDGVNVAARLEALATPGGIVLSRAAREQVRDKLNIGFEDMGEVEVKNIARPVRAFRVLQEGEVASQPPRARRRWLGFAVAASMILVGVIAGTMWWLGTIDKGLAKDAPILAMPEGPKIVVLPFDNLSGDPDQDYFVDGLTEDLTTRLAEHGYLFVIGRNSAFQYKGKSPDIREVGRNLGVDFVLEGSIQRSQERIRVNAQLLNAENGAHVWARKYDRELDINGVFEIQDQLTISISEAIGGSKGAITQSILKETRDRKPNDLSSFECVLLADSYWNSYDPSVHARALQCLKQAVVRDPEYAQAWRQLSVMYRAAFENGLEGSPNPLGESEEALKVALRLDPDDATIHLSRTNLMRDLGRMEDARSSIREAIRLSPTDPKTLHYIANAAVYSGMWETGWPIWQKVIQLDPSPPSWTYWTAFNYQHNTGNLQEAYRYALILKHETGDGFHWVAASEASVLSQMGRIDEARIAMDRVLKKRPNFAETARDELSVWWGHAPEYMERFMSGIYKAGLPKSAAASN